MPLVLFCPHWILKKDLAIRSILKFEIMEAINDEARLYDMTTAIATAKSFELLLENVKRMHLQKQVDGFILVYSDRADPVIEYLYENQIPFTLIGQPYQHENNIVYVDNDNQLLGKQATEFLMIA